MSESPYYYAPTSGGAEALRVDAQSVQRGDNGPPITVTSQNSPTLGLLFSVLGWAVGFILGVVTHALGFDPFDGGHVQSNVADFAQWAGPLVVIFLMAFVITMLLFSICAPCRPRLGSGDLESTPPTHEYPLPGDPRYDPPEFECEQHYNTMVCCISLGTATALIIGWVLGDLIVDIAGWLALTIVLGIGFVALLIWYTTRLFYSFQTQKNVPSH